MKTSTALRTVGRDNLERMTLQLRRRARNEKLQLDRLMGRVVAIGGAMGGAAAMGAIVGTRLRDNRPTTLFGAGDMELWVGGIAAVVGALIQAKTKKTGPRIFGELVEGGGVGVLSYWSGSRAEAKAMKALPGVPGAIAA